MVDTKKRVCKECGYFTEENVCPLCGSKQFLDKYKGKIVMFNVKDSVLSDKLNIKNNGVYALKYG